ncbi:integrase catalytic subunit [Rhodopirellula maiorica SM1]|uniref:Integrase catalytic subunit n=1 Tax=Rhodopirellula maiorica SM1 TaxID=1265738 RepID=M5R890_9BACT|nr:integrase catalytic subunit [Rhodopirellula maiorica SM1]
MPNHWHLVLRPRKDGTMGRLCGWLSSTYTLRYHAHHHTRGHGHLYQGPFKNFEVEDDSHFFTPSDSAPRADAPLVLKSGSKKPANEMAFGSQSDHEAGQGRSQKQKRSNRYRTDKTHIKPPSPFLILLATGPNEVWSWDITKLKGPEKWTYYYLYVILDIYSRCVVGWMLAHRESADLAKQLIETTIEKQKVPREQLILHSDRGPSMTSHSVAQLLNSLGVTKSHSRPHVSNDNPFSESQFKTMKYRPDFPQRFGCYEDALGFCRDFIGWYNDEHYHSGIGLLTPSSLHYGQAEKVIESRKQTLHGAWQKNPERFVHGIPTPASLPKAVWINAPKRTDELKSEAPEANCPGAPEVTSLTHPRSGYPLGRPASLQSRLPFHRTSTQYQQQTL